MEYINLGTFILITADRKNKIHTQFIKSLVNDDSIKSRFQGLFDAFSNNENCELFDHGFLVCKDDNLIGYVNTSYGENEKSVYLRAAIDKNQRGKHYGTDLLNELTEYIFLNHAYVESIKLKIDSDNSASYKTANMCGYTWLEGDIYSKSNPYINENKIR